MAQRFVFFSEGGLVCKQLTECKWHSGFSKEQRQRTVNSLHTNFKTARPDFKLLEISSVSDNPLGHALNAFNLKDSNGNYVEAVYQGSKVFEDGTQLFDLYSVSDASIAKFDKRKHTLGTVTHFNLYGKIVPANPWTMVFNWLWCDAVYSNKDLLNQVIQYDGFTDFFNKIHREGLGCYAQSASILVTLYKRGILDLSMQCIESFALNVYGTQLN